MRAMVPCGVAAHPGIVRAGRGRSGGLGDWTYAPGPAVRGLDPGRKPMSEQFDQQRIDAALAGVDDWPVDNVSAAVVGPGEIGRASCRDRAWGSGRGA